MFDAVFEQDHAHSVPAVMKGRGEPQHRALCAAAREIGEHQREIHAAGSASSTFAHTASTVISPMGVCGVQPWAARG